MFLELQQRIFNHPFTRRELLNYQPQSKKTYRVQVFRNHSFELVEHAINLYLDYAGFGISFSYSGYDDSFSFLELDVDVDLVLLWIDITRYTMDVSNLLNERVQNLRMQFQKPILVIPFGQDLVLTQPGVVVFSLNKIEQTLASHFLDERAKAISGTALSGSALLAISRTLGLQYFPAILRPALKAVIVDLDNTLYQGVLGEDGAERLILTDEHIKLQMKLKKLSEEGYFLCVASKNNAKDISDMFQIRTDFPLQEKDFSIICASWRPKAESIEEIAKILNIYPDSMVFIDDNIGELMAVQMAFPEIKLIHADEKGEITRKILEEYPGLFKIFGSMEDSIRKEDIRANRKRAFLRQNMSQEEYIRSLDITLTFSADNTAQIVRISELANKTNQFIFNYQRYTQGQIEEKMASKNERIVSVSLSDKLSDSGLIGVCVGKKQQDYVEIEECFVSCRALGRGIDYIIVLEAIRQITEYFCCKRVQVQFRKGDRNQPAEKFVHTYLNRFLEHPEYFSFEFPQNLLTIEADDK